jgi:hypothetical protein
MEQDQTTRDYLIAVQKYHAITRCVSGCGDRGQALIDAAYTTVLLTWKALGTEAKRTQPLPPKRGVCAEGGVTGLFCGVSNVSEGK